MSNKTEVKPEEPTTTPGAATSVEHIAPPDQHATGAQHKEQKQQLKHSVERGDRERDPNQSSGQHSTGSYTGTTGGQRSGS